MTDRPWHEVRHYFACILDDFKCAQVPTGLPTARSWGGGNSWPDVVERITAESGFKVRKAAQIVVREVLNLEKGRSPSLVHGDFGPHNILWDESGTPALIDFDNACSADPAIDVAPLIGFYGAAKVGEIVDADVLARAKAYRASLPLQVAAAAALGADRKLQSHALSNFARRLEAGSLHDPAATWTRTIRDPLRAPTGYACEGVPDGNNALALRMHPRCSFGGHGWPLSLRSGPRGQLARPVLHQASACPECSVDTPCRNPPITDKVRRPTVAGLRCGSPGDRLPNRVSLEDAGSAQDCSIYSG